MLGLTTLQSPSQKPESVEHKVKMPLLLGGGANKSNRTRLEVEIFEPRKKNLVV